MCNAGTQPERITARRDLHNVYYANLGQRACINKCYIIIQIKCFNLHTFYRPPAAARASGMRRRRACRRPPNFLSSERPGDSISERSLRWQFSLRKGKSSRRGLERLFLRVFRLLFYCPLLENGGGSSGLEAIHSLYREIFVSSFISQVSVITGFISTVRFNQIL